MTTKNIKCLSGKYLLIKKVCLWSLNTELFLNTVQNSYERFTKQHFVTLTKLIPVNGSKA